MTDLPNSTITELLAQLAKGDEKAATRLFEHYHGFLYAFVRHLLPNDADAEEITLDVLLAVCRKPESYARQSKFSTWLCGIAKFKVADHLRQQRKMPPVENLDEAVISALPDPDWNFVAQLEALEDEDALGRCRDALPPEYQEALFWVFYQGESLEVIAMHQECPVGTVKSRLFHARRRLRECMQRWLNGGRHA